MFHYVHRYSVFHVTKQCVVSFAAAHSTVPLRCVAGSHVGVEIFLGGICGDGKGTGYNGKLHDN